MKRLTLLICILLLSVIIIPKTAFAIKKLSGRIVFHSYSNYDAGDSKLYLYNFGEDELTCLSSDWNNVKNPMNACFRKDGKAITFMGQSNNDEWDVFEYVFGEDRPINLTKENGLDDEDPKYDPKGKSIVFKQSNPSGNGTRIVRYSLKSSKQTILISGSTEKSMPYFNKNGKKIYYVEGNGRNMFIKSFTISNKKISTVFKSKGTQSYYPIVSDDGKYIYFSKGYSKNNRADQIIRYCIKNKKIKTLKCNSKKYDCSDTCCVSDKYIIVSSTKPGGKGGYDLYLVNTKTGSMTSLTKYNQLINTPLEELGCDYEE